MGGNIQWGLGAIFMDVGWVASCIVDWVAIFVDVGWVAPCIVGAVREPPLRVYRSPPKSHASDLALQPIRPMSHTNIGWPTIANVLPQFAQIRLITFPH
ncbi:MAG: hypothetical protein WCD18_00100 [Thermosynechococcaceae cyanobacterium]